MIRAGLPSPAQRRSGITLTEILIAILIMAVGLASLATLFPLGLLRLRDAARYSRSSYLSQSATADLSSRSLLSWTSFITLTPWYGNALASGPYSPFIQDTPYYGAGVDWATDPAGPGAYAGTGGGPSGSSVANAASTSPPVPNPNYPAVNGPGLPFAYDPLWRYQTVNPANPQANGLTPGGYYPFDNGGFEARFGSGIHFVRQGDADGNLPSAHGLQRISNFNRPSIMPASLFIPSIFVSGEDVVWQEPANQGYSLATNAMDITANGLPFFGSPPNTPSVGPAPSPVVPDLYISSAVDPTTGKQYHTYQPVNDFRYSWMFTGQLTNSSNEACFDGNVVIFENRPFDIQSVTAPDGTSWYQVDGETVVEAIFGHGGNIQTPAGANAGYAAGSARTVLLRWSSSVPDPVVKVGDWIADVTYERSQTEVQSRWWQNNVVPFGIANLTNNNEWDNLPAQRCFWYQVQKVQAAIPDPYLGTAYRSMVVYVNQNLQSRTLLTAVGTPSVINAALIAPSVVNVIPQTIFVR